MTAFDLSDAIKDLPLGIIEVDAYGGMALLPLEEGGIERLKDQLRRIVYKHGLRLRTKGIVWKVNGLHVNKEGGTV